MAGGDLSWKDIQPVLKGLAERLDYIEEHLVHLGEAVGYRYTPTNTGIPPEVKELARGQDCRGAATLPRVDRRKPGTGQGRGPESLNPSSSWPGR